LSPAEERVDWLKRLLRANATGGGERWVVVDVETSGMDTTNDALISIGGVAMSADGIVTPSDSIEIIVRQETFSSRENILVHGVGKQAQLNGVAPPAAVGHFVDFVRTAPIVAFHAPFDRAFIARSVKYYVNQPFDNPWLDLAELAPALEPQARLRSLDEWLEHYHIPVTQRHSAAADAFATALLAARLIPAARRQGATGYRALQQLARNARWLQ
jgi:DNA polymerase III subunit epsilon